MAPSKKLITLSNLSFGYDDLPVLEQNSLSIQEGSLIGIIGPNGGGKTTFLKLLMGFLQPDQGIIKIFGKTPEQARTKIGYVPQYHKCDREFPITVLELVLLGALCKTSLFGVYPKKVKQQAFFLIEMLGLSEHIKKSFGLFLEALPKELCLQERSFLILTFYFSMSLQPISIQPLQISF
jgi:zinc transport system ATP-binding protein